MLREIEMELAMVRQRLKELAEKVQEEDPELRVMAENSVSLVEIVGDMLRLDVHDTEKLLYYIGGDPLELSDAEYWIRLIRMRHGLANMVLNFFPEEQIDEVAAGILDLSRQREAHLYRLKKLGGV